MTSIANGWLWFGFILFVVFALSVDTFLLGKKMLRPHDSMRAAVCWTFAWVGTALLFNAFLWFYVILQTDSTVIANQIALQFFSGYLIEKSLSIDNLFAFYLVFQAFHIPSALQQRLLAYGLWGAIVFRLLFIMLGVWLIMKFHWILYLMGAFLAFTGIRIILLKEKRRALREMAVMKLTRRLFRITPERHGKHFFIRKNRLLYATPLFLALVFVEFSDIVFAMDSIPVIFSITTDPFIIWSSNIFAILGLRSLYFVLVGMVDRFRQLKYGIALILIFIGSKMMIDPWLPIPTSVSLAVIMTILVVFSLRGNHASH